MDAEDHAQHLSLAEEPHLWPDPGRQVTAAAMSLSYVLAPLALVALNIVIALNVGAPRGAGVPASGLVFLAIFAAALACYWLAFRLCNQRLDTAPEGRLPHEDDDSQVQARVFSAVMGGWLVLEMIPALGFLAWLASPDFRQSVLFAVVWLAGAARLYPAKRRWLRWSRLVAHEIATAKR